VSGRDAALHRRDELPMRRYAIPILDSYPRTVHIVTAGQLGVFQDGTFWRQCSRGEANGIGDALRLPADAVRAATVRPRAPQSRASGGRRGTGEAKTG
jgi:hypothetical protein